MLQYLEKFLRTALPACPAACGRAGEMKGYKFAQPPVHRVRTFCVNRLLINPSGARAMNKTISGSMRLAVAAAAAIGALTAPGLVLAQEHHEGPHHFEPYRTPHMVFDNRYQHGHYYPAIGYSVNVLPP